MDHLSNIASKAPSPAYVVDTGSLEANLKLLKRVEDESGCRILLALKGFAMYSLFPLIKRYLSGTAASGLHEAKLGHEFFGSSVHAYSPAYRDGEIEALNDVADHIIFNSPAQWQTHKELVKNASCGLRVNPEYSEIKVEIYNPCAPCSRLGTLRSHIKPGDLDGLEGLHFHALCEQNADALEGTLKSFEEKFSEFIPQMKWINFGGGHHITREDYDVPRLIEIIKGFSKRHPNVQIYLEPGEAIALNTGYLVTTVLDIIENEMQVAILDTSATCHMPDVLEMPYRPEIIGAGKAEEKQYTYRLGGPSCLAGDVIGDYSFDEPLKPGSRLLFTDMAHYTMVKNTTFNGVPLPSITAYYPENVQLKVIKSFGYEDYKARLS